MNNQILPTPKEVEKLVFDISSLLNGHPLNFSLDILTVVKEYLTEMAIVTLSDVEANK